MKPILLFLTFWGTLSSFGQELNLDLVTHIELNFRHSMMGGAATNIQLINREGDAEIEIRLYNQRFGVLPYEADTIISISEKEFNQVVKKINKISISSIVQRLDFTGFDGVTYTLSFGSYANKISYQIWCPTIETNKYGLKPFYSACVEIIELAGFDAERFDKYGAD